MGTRLALALWFVVPALVACSEPQAPLREWRPEDHGEPSQLSGQTEAATENAPEELEAGGQARAAEALFNVSCASCHGRDGRGGGPGLPPGAQVPDFSVPEFQASRTNEALAQVIHDGRGMMPGFSKQVTPEGIAVLVAHVRSFAPKPAPEAAPTTAPK
jgi:mono/diheme cytochrome c family protein